MQRVVELLTQIGWWTLGSAVCLLILAWLMRSGPNEATRQPQPCRHYNPAEDQTDEEVRVETHA